ncbi:6126_t:CDS:1 [Acaulospora morrowiae]|uniref:GDP-fucose protein O-fucosyltransferase 2 n=1 Tax=Acaulospora morrowiae TaxID=94023 RepID=A0A9N9AYY0_9GLOM|nr:6126_t:CDS:1 [Acaulospora morrowiae]
MISPFSKNIRIITFYVFVFVVLLNVIIFLKTQNDNTLINIQSADNYTHDELDVQVNKKYCGVETKNGCRFLFAYHMPEQETSSNRHFLAFTQIARQLNRTIVLTNVGQSRIWSARQLPFDFYYNVQAFQKKFPDVNFITQEEFKKWTKERHSKPNAIHANIENKKPKNTFKYVKTKPKVLKEMRRFDFTFNNSSSFLQINIGNKNSWIKEEGHRSMINFLENTLSLEAEVILVVHDKNYLIKTDDSIPYAKHLTEAAERIVRKLDQYIAIHWRMERAEVEMMPECAKRLVDYLNRLTSRTGIKNIYLATDYPLSRKPQSDTFHKLSNEHHQAMKILNSSFQLDTWISTHSLDYLKEYTALERPLKDELKGGGLQGIVDKLILINATYFVSGPKGCCRILSKYTRRVVDERKELVKKGVTRIKNVVDRW